MITYLHSSSINILFASKDHTEENKASLLTVYVFVKLR